MWSSIIQAGSSLLGGFLDNKADKETTMMNNENQLRVNAENIAMQKEFAQHGVRWKVEDAKAAGLHPLYALGGSTSSFTPSSVSVNAPTGSNRYAQMGQDISRAINAQETDDQAERRKLENELLRAQIAKENAFTDEMRLGSMQRIGEQTSNVITFPAMGPYSGGRGAYEDVIPQYPLPPKARANLGPFGRGKARSVGDVEYKPDEVTSTYDGRPHRTAGRHALFKEVMTPGGPMLVPNSDDFEIDAALLPAMFGSNWNDYGLRQAINSFTGGLYEKFNRGLYDYFDSRRADSARRRDAVANYYRERR